MNQRFRTPITYQKNKKTVQKYLKFIFNVNKKVRLHNSIQLVNTKSTYKFISIERCS